ncbi:DUF4442 domain-containing protein [Thalassotalea marina]|uniref:DUF4442 domain-containing protein n=1 Tax=Thalassotalea marina TaxID=1673741 RepID=A0A919BFM8_9GAMM|nr:DUF4442 domain-containing protein [Thalassotalea marina]GHF87199.1 hypothetical protein GCM10017161_13390 [Thalassotalea marina]
MTNKLARLINRLNKLPFSLRRFLVTKAFCSKVKYAGTTGIVIEKLTVNEAILLLKNRKKVQNHIGGVHAIAAAVLAESATGVVFGMNVRDDCLPLLKTMTINYKRRMQGDLTAIAHITGEQQQQLSSSLKGEMLIKVEIHDESGEQPLECHMEWAWIEKRR